MISTKRGLVMLAAIAVLLLLAVIVVGPRHSGAIDRTLVPGFDATRITELVIERPGDRHAPIDLVRNADGSWRWHAPDGFADVRTIDHHDDLPVDPSAVDNLLAALRAARWHRSASRNVAGASTATLRVLASGATLTTIQIGASITGAEQTWIIRDGRALLVDSWVAHALAPSRLDVAIKRPLANKPIESHRPGVWIDPEITRAAREAFDNLEYLSLDATKVDQPGSQVVDVRELGICDNARFYVMSPVGNGCVAPDAWARAIGAREQLEKPDTVVADRRPLPFDPAKLRLRDNAVLELAGRPRLDGNDADGDRVRELVTALTTPGTLVPRPATKPLGTLVATDATGTEVTLELFPTAVARQAENIAIETDRLATILQPSSAYRDPTRWREDPTTISSLTLDDATYTRGAVLGEWTRKPEGKPGDKTDAALVDALASAIATVRASARQETAAHPRMLHRVTVTITPPAGAPSTHALQMGATDPAGCAGTADGAPVELPLDLCTAVLALAP